MLASDNEPPRSYLLTVALVSKCLDVRDRVSVFVLRDERSNDCRCSRRLAKQRNPTVPLACAETAGYPKRCRYASDLSAVFLTHIAPSCWHSMSASRVSVKRTGECYALRVTAKPTLAPSSFLTGDESANDALRVLRNVETCGRTFE